MTQGSTAAFTYDSEHERIKQCVGASCATSDTRYVNDPASGAMSERYTAGATNIWKDYIKAEGRLVAIRSVPVAGGSASWSYMITDHLGSPSMVTDASGGITEALAYDAWGKRRNASTGADAACASITPSTTRGFTGHEMLDAACAINMNARLYDPALGRFLAVDPVISNFFESQTLNPYTYVNNRPLTLTDPTGAYSGELMKEAGKVAGKRLAFDAGVAMADGPEPGPADVVAGVLTIVTAGAALWDVGKAVLAPDDKAADSDTKRAEKVDQALGRDKTTLRPGEHARESVPAHSGRPTAAEQREINRIGRETGCHTCGTKDPGTKSGNFIGDHQPSAKLQPGGKQVYYPHCDACSRRQAGEVTREILRRRKELEEQK